MLFRATESSKSTSSLVFKLSQIEAIKSSLIAIRDLSQALTLDATYAEACEALDLLGRVNGLAMSKADGQRLFWAISAVSRNVVSQTAARTIFIADGRYAALLTSYEPPFGRGVSDAFPEAIEEVEEAAKCLALERTTAVVFHLMRAIELAVASCSTKFGFIADKEWGKMLSDLGRGIESLPKGTLKTDWSAAHSLLFHVKEAWRNPTMHPKKTYTETESASVFEAVKAFMQALSPLILRGLQEG